MTSTLTQQQLVPKTAGPASTFDVAVIGGGAAGLSAALVLGRARRSVIVIDAGSPRNAPAPGVHGFLTRDGIPPAELLTLGRQEVMQYGGSVVHGQAQTARRTADGFEVTLEHGQRVTARRLLVTTGLIDELPAIPGLRERWGRDVLHCPYCHGWEFQDQPIGIVGTGPWSLHQASLFRQWTDDVALFTHTMPALTDAQTEELAARDIRVVHGLVSAVESTNDRLSGVRLADGRLIERRALVVLPRLVARSQVLADLGIAPVAHPSGVGEHIPADPTGKTGVPGVWVAGNVTDLMAQVVAAAASGAMAGAVINADLITEETARAVTTYRERQTAAPTHQTARAS